MKALTVRQPWADLIVGGDKLVENRTWSTTHRGWLLIHASKSWDPYDEFPIPVPESRINEMWSSAIIGAVFLSRVILEEAALRDFNCEEDTAYYPWVNGPVCWVFTKAIRFPKPISHSGQVGLWTPKKSALSKCRKYLASL